MTENKYVVTDNFLSKNDFFEIKSIIMSENFPWYFNNKIIYGSNEKDLNNFQFTHVLYENNRPVSEYFYIAEKIMHKIDAFSLLKAKINLGTRTEKNIVGGWHNDFYQPCTTAVYYLNNNDGHTLFEDGKKVESVENRLVYFDSMIKHSGVSHTNSKARYVINLNYIKNIRK